MDGGEGQGVSKAANQRLQSAFGTIESLTAAVGIDIQEVLAAAASRQLGTGRKDDAVTSVPPSNGETDTSPTAASAQTGTQEG
jgi:hypothetical protein